jgi:hypothetical protein
VDGTSSGSCPIVGCVTSGVATSGADVRDFLLVIQGHRQHRVEC